jgi:hypothetical protein
MDKHPVDQINPSPFENQPTPDSLLNKSKDSPVEAKRNLEILLGDKNLDPNRAQAIREQIAAIDSGEISPIPGDLDASSSESRDRLDYKSFSADQLAKLLNGDSEFAKSIDISQDGTGFDVTQAMIEQAKRNSQDSKN